MVLESLNGQAAAAFRETFPGGNLSQRIPGWERSWPDAPPGLAPQVPADWVFLISVGTWRAHISIWPPHRFGRGGRRTILV